MQTLTIFLLYILVFIIGILVMIFGWGLEPQSWGWIIGGTFFSHVAHVLHKTYEKAEQEIKEKRNQDD